MSDCIINPARLQHEVTINTPTLFFVNPGETGSVLQLAKKLNGKQHKLFNSNLFEIAAHKNIFWAGPALGAPAAVLVLEKLIALGCRNFIVFGWCGSLVSHLRTGEVFIPDGFLSEEGTSKHYPPVEQFPATNASSRNKLSIFMQGKGYSVKQGRIWSTDALYRETYQKIHVYSHKGIMAVDMEFSALFTVAAFRAVSLTAAMLVSDELFHEKWVPKFAGKSFKRQSLEVFACLSEFTCSLI